MKLESYYYNVAKWLPTKLDYHKICKHQKVFKKQVNIGEIWECDLGYNIGEEKNKKRPVLVVSNNKVNRSGKTIVVCLTDAKGKTNDKNMPLHNSWYLLLANTDDPYKMHKPNRKIPNGIQVYDFISKDSMIQLEEIRSVSKSRLSQKKLGNINPDDLIKIKKKLSKVFEI